ARTLGCQKLLARRIAKSVFRDLPLQGRSFAGCVHETFAARIEEEVAEQAVWNGATVIERRRDHGALRSPALEQCLKAILLQLLLIVPQDLERRAPLGADVEDPGGLALDLLALGRRQGASPLPLVILHAHDGVPHTLGGPKQEHELVEAPEVVPDDD